jgi:large subunit ribosomal protein L13
LKTYVPREGQVEKKWYVIDAEGKVLGRLAAEAAALLRGKHKPQFTPFLDCGDHVIVVNADKVRVTGNKAFDKMYYRHSGYVGSLREMNFETLMAKHPTRAVEFAIRGMLPHNKLGRKIGKHLRVYAGPDHGQEAQNPQVYELS